jgi:hypothetical protein
VIRASRKPDGSGRSASRRQADARRGRHGERAQPRSGCEWRVVDDLPTSVPIATRELDVIERWLAAAGNSEFGGSSAEHARTAPNQNGAGENPEAVTHTIGDVL